MSAGPACVFDAYGTLLDVNSAVSEASAVLGHARAGELSALWRRKQLEYTWLRSMMRRHASFARVTADALSYSLATLGIAEPGLERDLLTAYRRLAAYPEVPGMLRTLRERGVRTAILSNGDADMLSEGLAHAGLADGFDMVLSVAEVGVFKPASEVYRLATERLGLPPGDIHFMSANGWDVHGAAAFGFRTVWVNRARLPDERLPGTAIAALDDLTALPDLVSSDLATGRGEH